MMNVLEAAASDILLLKNRNVNEIMIDGQAPIINLRLEARPIWTLNAFPVPRAPQYVTQLI